MEKEEIAHNEQFLLFPQCFLPILKIFLPFSSKMKLLSAKSFGLVSSKICRWGKGTPSPKRLILDFSKGNESAVDNFEFDEN